MAAQYSRGDRLLLGGATITRMCVRRLRWFLCPIMLAPFIGGAVMLGPSVWQCFQIDLNSAIPTTACTRFVDRHGHSLGVYGTEWLSITDTPPLALQLVTAAEDERFWTRSGPFDFRAFVRAVTRPCGTM